MDGNQLNEPKMKILEELKKTVIVSCQGQLSNGPFHTVDHILLLAEAAVFGGAKALRVNSPEHVSAIKKKFPSIIIVGIHKIPQKQSEVFITPNMKAVEQLIDAGSDIVALDGTNRINNDGKYAWETIKEIKTKYPKQLVMADIATLEDAMLSIQVGADIISTTLNGYTKETAVDSESLNLRLIKEIRTEYPLQFLVAEGRIWTVADALAALNEGADALVIGSAITSPSLITKRFMDLVFNEVI